MLCCLGFHQATKAQKTINPKFKLVRKVQKFQMCVSGSKRMYTIKKMFVSVMDVTGWDIAIL